MKSFLFIVIIITTCISAMAQKGVNDSVKKAANAKSSIALPSKSISQPAEPVKAYKAVPYWKKIIDSLKTQQTQLDKFKIQVEDLNKENTNLKNDLKTANDSLLVIRNGTAQVVQKESIPEDKTNLILGILGFLAICLGITTYLSVSAKREAKYRIGLYEDLSKEYQTHKLKSNEKEKKLSRELQTERNRLEELLNNR
ncbi:MAG: hypothetical protein JWN56_1762 [Sphingobacteriales bacterium]|nr:hypothetical protein [Sphingobacteriales bacterium]